MLSLRVGEGHQIPLIHEVHADDQYLLNTLEGEWFEILHAFAWEDYRPHAAAYYEALYDFNTQERQRAVEASETPLESKAQAQQRLLFDRATMQAPHEPCVQIIYEGNVVEFKAPKVDPMALAPGVVPPRLVGRKPKCFFSLLKSFPMRCSARDRFVQKSWWGEETVQFGLRNRLISLSTYLNCQHRRFRLDFFGLDSEIIDLCAGSTRTSVCSA